MLDIWRVLYMTLPFWTLGDILSTFHLRWLQPVYHQFKWRRESLGLGIRDRIADGWPKRDSFFSLEGGMR